MQNAPFFIVHSTSEAIQCTNIRFAIVPLNANESIYLTIEWRWDK